MKYGDIQKLRESDFITDEQQQKIIEHFKLKEDSNRFLVIISFVGAVLVAAGLVLLIASNWDAIPRGVKVAVGVALMLGAHGTGWWLRAVRPDYLKTGEALQLAGSLLLLGNIALAGRAYDLISRPPNVFLFWWVGIAALPWLLRSEVHHLLALLAFGIWFGKEVNEPNSLIVMRDESQVLAYALLGLVYVGFGYVLRRGAFASFAGVTERLGILALLVFSYPLTWPGFLSDDHHEAASAQWVLPALAVVAVALVALGAKKQKLDQPWRRTWAMTLVVAAGLLVAAFFVPHERTWSWLHEFRPVNALAALALLVFCLLQIQVGLRERSTFLVNLGLVFIALDIITSYINLFGTMARTGLMFVVSGVFLIVFGFYLEKKRRQLMKQIKAAKTGAEVPS